MRELASGGAYFRVNIPLKHQIQSDPGANLDQKSKLLGFQWSSSIDTLLNHVY